MIVLGAAFLGAAFAGLAVLSTPFNVLAFRLPNVFSSIDAGLVLLVVESYGRVTLHAPPDNPYRTSGDRLTTSFPERFAGDPGGVDAEPEVDLDGIDDADALPPSATTS